jgi:hypothetical protein
MTRTEELRARAKLVWPDQKGLYCYVQNAEYELAFASGEFPRATALERQAAYKASVAAKFAQANGEQQPAPAAPAPERLESADNGSCHYCGTKLSQFSREYHADGTLVCFQTEQPCTCGRARYFRPGYEQNQPYRHIIDNAPACLQTARPDVIPALPELPALEEIETVTDYSINPMTGRRKKPHTCKYCGNGPVFFHEHKPGQWILVFPNGTPCSPRCAEKMGYTQADAQAHESPEPDQQPAPTSPAAAAPDPYAMIPAGMGEPQVIPHPVNPADKPKTRAELLAELLAEPAQLDEAQVRAIIRQELSQENRVTVDLRIQINDLPIIDCREQHERFNILVTLLAARIPTMLVGPAGSGKTTACHRAAEQLNSQFRMIACGPIPQEASLIGYMDAKGEYVRTPLRDAFEHGGVFLFDEIDAAHPGTIVKLNALLANSIYSFPDGATLPRHEDFIPVAAANTFGTGADRQYVGRNQLDSATLDRFFVLEWPYDWSFCQQLAGLPVDRKPYALKPSGYTQAQWVQKVQKVSAYIASKAIRHVTGPRAALYGVKLLDALNKELLEDGLLWKGLSAVQRAEIESAVQ